MTRFLCVAALVLGMAASALAQIAGGSITGTATDEQGGVLPGVTITMVTSDRTATAVTDDGGKFRFLNLAPGFYEVTAGLEGFTTVVRQQIEVRVGANVDLPMTMRVAALAETITVTGESPIVDTRATGTSTNFTTAELEMVPTSRDPWALLRSVPGVLVDRVNVGGNETGQQSNTMTKGTRPQDAVWTMDGVEITDMAATGASPTYFNYDNFEEIQVSTAGQSIQQRTGGIGLNFVVKRGTNQYKGMARGYFTNDSLESDNVPAELRALGVTKATSDHNEQISDYGFEIGGPILRDRAWFFGSYSQQDVRLVRRSGNLIDRTILKNPNVKVNWQASRTDMVNFLFFNGDKVKHGRSPGVAGINFDAPTATFDQRNFYADNPLHGLWKIEDNHTFGAVFFLTSKYAYYNTGFTLDPVGGMDDTSGRSFMLGRSFGSVSRSVFTRPQHTVNLDGAGFRQWLSASHDLKVGFGWRRADAFTETRWPGNGMLALENSATDFRARVFRVGAGTNRIETMNVYLGDTIQKGPMTLDVGIRFDRQGGSALPSETDANPAFPALVPGISFDGYESPFTWNTFSPRTGLTWALDQSRRTLLRVSFSRYAGQLATGNVGFVNPTALAGFADYRWVDANGDHLAQPGEVDTSASIGAGNGFNPASPTTVSSANRIDPDLEAPVTTSVIAGLDRELMPNFGLQVSYSYTRTSNLFGNNVNNVTPRVGVRPGPNGDYAAGPLLTGVLHDGRQYSVPTYIPNAAAVAAGGNGFLLTNWDGYDQSYSGLEVQAVKRMSNRWMARVGFAWNDTRDNFQKRDAMYDTNGNPTPTDTEPLVDGGQHAELTAGSGAGDIFINAKWQFSANGVYVLPYDIEAGISVFGRQGYPFVPFRQTSLGADTLRVLVAPAIDTYRMANLWNTDLRFARRFGIGQNANIQFIAELFNLFNANTELVRVRNASASSYRTLSQNLSPRIWRLGLRVGF